MRVLVTGGNGFLGRAVVRELLARGHAVRVASRSATPSSVQPGAEARAVDLADAAGLREAAWDCEGIVHCAALTGFGAPRAAFERTNVVGTRNVLAAARAAGVRRLVHTSSPSVCFDGRDHRGADESLPYPGRFLAHYPRTKAIAEREVLAASDAVLSTCALRPHLVLGPGDPHLLPRLVARARAGRLPVVGRGTNEVSFTWVENAAVAHADALERLVPGAPCAGRAYFVAQADPVELWPWLTELFTRAGLPPPRGRMPRAVAYAAGAVCEAVWSLARRRTDPPMTRFLALQLAADHSYSIAAAARDLGYVERVDTAEATRRLAADLRTRFTVR